MVYINLENLEVVIQMIQIKEFRTIPHHFWMSTQRAGYTELISFNNVGKLDYDLYIICTEGNYVLHDFWVSKINRSWTDTIRSDVTLKSIPN